MEVFILLWCSPMLQLSQGVYDAQIGQALNASAVSHIFGESVCVRCRGAATAIEYDTGTSAAIISSISGLRIEGFVRGIDALILYGSLSLHRVELINNRYGLQAISVSLRFTAEASKFIGNEYGISLKWRGGRSGSVSIADCIFENNTDVGFAVDFGSAGSVRECMLTHESVQNECMLKLKIASTKFRCNLLCEIGPRYSNTRERMEFRWNIA